MDNSTTLKRHLRTNDQTMNFSALSVAAIFAVFAQTMAEPLPQIRAAAEGCPTRSTYCGFLLSFFNPFFHYLFIIEGGGSCVS